MRLIMRLLSHRWLISNYLRRFNFIWWWGRHLTSCFSWRRWFNHLQICSAHSLWLLFISRYVSSSWRWRRKVLSDTLELWRFIVRLSFRNSGALEWHILLISLNWLFQNWWLSHWWWWRSHSSLLRNVRLLMNFSSSPNRLLIFFFMMLLLLKEWWRWWLYWPVHGWRNPILLLDWWRRNPILLLNRWWLGSCALIHSWRRLFEILGIV